MPQIEQAQGSGWPGPLHPGHQLEPAQPGARYHDLSRHLRARGECVFRLASHDLRGTGKSAVAAVD